LVGEILSSISSDWSDTSGGDTRRGTARGRRLLSCTPKAHADAALWCKFVFISCSSSGDHTLYSWWM
jgi:hypothetical protein